MYSCIRILHQDSPTIRIALLSGYEYYQDTENPKVGIAINT